MGWGKGIPNNYRFIFRTNDQIYGKASFSRLLCNITTYTNTIYLKRFCTANAKDRKF